MKHPVHILHFGHVPIVERLVERGCFIKHPVHIRRFLRSVGDMPVNRPLTPIGSPGNLPPLDNARRVRVGRESG